MATIIVLGAGLGGMAAAYEIRAAVGKDHAITVIGESPHFNFTPSNPWVAIGWRKPADIRLDAGPALKKHAIDFIDMPAASVLPAQNQVRLVDGRVLDYDYLVIATGPRLAFDEVPGPRPALGLIPNRSAPGRMPRAPGRPTRNSSRTRARSWSAPCRARAASAPPTNSP